MLRKRHFQELKVIIIAQFARLFVKSLQPGDSEVTFAVFESTVFT